MGGLSNVNLENVIRKKTPYKSLYGYIKKASGKTRIKPRTRIRTPKRTHKNPDRSEAIKSPSLSDLTWEDSLSSQVIRDDLSIIQELPQNEREAIMKPVRDMAPESLPQVVSQACNKFVEDFVPDTFDRRRKALLHKVGVDCERNFRNTVSSWY